MTVRTYALRANAGCPRRPALSRTLKSAPAVFHLPGPGRLSPPRRAHFPESGGWTRDLIESASMPPVSGSFVVSEEPTTAVVQRYLDALTGDTPAEPIVRELLGRAAYR